MKRALFLDRDDIINEDRRYVHRIEDFHFIDGIFDICRAAIDAGMTIIVVTNQAGIGRGLFTERQFHVLTDWMKAQFADQGATIDQVYYCPTSSPVRHWTLQARLSLPKAKPRNDPAGAG